MPQIDRYSSTESCKTPHLDEDHNDEESEDSESETSSILT